MPSNPRLMPSQLPVVAISTAAGAPRDGSQQVIGVAAVVVAILGSVHHVATRSGSPPSSADTICHGGTFKLDGFEINKTPLDNFNVSGVLLLDIVPRARTSSRISAGPPLLTIWSCVGSVVTLALASASSTLTTSALSSFRAKKCWLTRTLSSRTHPSVFPSVRRGWLKLPEAGQLGVETWRTRPSPLSFHASMPLE